MKTKQTATESQPVPLEMLKELSSSRKPVSIGIPKENLKIEKRLVFTPEAVEMIVNAGHEVVFEKNAGCGIHYSDIAYAQTGAKITADRKQVLACDLIFKIAPPTVNEIQWMKKKSTVFSLLQMLNMNLDMIKEMGNKQINAIAYDLLTPDGLDFPVRNAISEIEGTASIFVASELLNNEKSGKGILLGGIPGVSPTEIVIIGAGMAGTAAARAALALGALVKVFDSNIAKLRQLQSHLGQAVFTSVFQPNVLKNAFKSADVVIGAMHYINDPVHEVVSEDIIKSMKQGSVLIDLRVDQGGCFETTCFLPSDHPAIFEKQGVLHYCIPNLSSQVARTTAMVLSNIFVPLILQLSESNGAAAIATTDAFRSGLYLYGGKLVSNFVAKHFNLTASDIGLYLSAF
ncbi:MAG: NAD-binding protein [Candidatus Azobacteroides sp.]|nr:NAD-binding protein [Candidatus Azobacteroides sp.]